ncbi:MAG TPA: hypothetical protein PLP66_14170 [Phycisphaerae bacterium]|nr:hypothetical protein [Phycisphaerae bacterium]HQL54562.1 hypothetical protein [Phycisphaerae bacterium]
MPDRLEQGAAWLEDQRTRHMSRTVTYLRGDDSVDVAATIGRTEFEQADEYGVVHRTESRDFLVLTDALVLGDKAVLPQTGDRVRETAGDQIFLYEVMAPGGEPPYRYSDPYRRTLRIHTKHVGMERA